MGRSLTRTLSATEAASKPRKRAKKAKPPLRKLGGLFGSTRVSFAVPVTGGNYAPETIDLTDRTLTGGVFMPIADLSLDVESLPATAVVEMDLLRPGGNRLTAGDWNLARKSWSVAGLVDMLPLAAWYGVRYRVKSGGTSGTAILCLSWD